MRSDELVQLSAGDLSISESSWMYVFVSCDGKIAWSVEASPDLVLNLGACSTKQWSDGAPRGAASMRVTLRGDA